MNSKFGVVFALAALTLTSVQADTIYLKNGVRFDGVVTPVPENQGLYKVTAGKRQLFYRDSEIDRIEKNAKTGLLDKEALLARWEERNKKLTEETGLTAEQRRMVRGLLFELKSEDASTRIAVRDKLQKLQEEFDVYGYMLSLYPELSPLLAPNVLRALAELDPKRSLPLLQESAQKNYYEVRVEAIELLRRLRHHPSVSLIARGLADFNQSVQISAAYAMAELGVKESTPALITLLANPDRRVAGAARESLSALWAGELGDKRPVAVSEWEAFWRTQTVPGTPIKLAQLEPLSPEEDELKQTIDSN